MMALDLMIMKVSSNLCDSVITDSRRGTKKQREGDLLFMHAKGGTVYFYVVGLQKSSKL